MRPILAIPLLSIAVACASSATAATYHFRGKPGIIPAAETAPSPTPSFSDPDPFSFLGLIEVAPNSTQTSERVELTGHSAMTVRISGDESAEFRVCFDQDCREAMPWGSSPLDIPAASERRSFVEIRMTSGPAAGPTRDAILAVGRSTATWTVTSRRSAVETTTVGLPSGWELEYVPQSVTVSNPQALDGFATPARIRDGDLSQTAWRYQPGHAGLTVANYSFEAPIEPQKCLLAWRDEANTTKQIRIRFVSTIFHVQSTPGINVYNGPCGAPAGGVAGTHATLWDLSTIDILEYKVGR